MIYVSIDALQVVNPCKIMGAKDLEVEFKKLEPSWKFSHRMLKRKKMNRYTLPISMALLPEPIAIVS